MSLRSTSTRPNALAPAIRAAAPPTSAPTSRRGTHGTSAPPLGRSVLRLSPLLLLLALVGLAAVRGQEVVLERGSAGCIGDRPPGPPANLKAKPKDGKVVLTWDAPRGGECVTLYVVNVDDPYLRSAGGSAQSTSTGGFSAVVDNLANGRPYGFRVQAYSSKFLTGGTAQVTATPSDRCDAGSRPGAPTNVRVQPGDGSARVCWDGVEGDQCVDQYRLSAAPVDGPGFRSSGGNKISRGGCTNITDLQNGVKYKFSVVPVSNKHGEGPAGSITAVVGPTAAGANGWACRGMEGCHPSRPGLCSSGGGCDAVQRLGQCRSPAMHDVDWVNRQVTQWCTQTCGCDLSPAQGGSLMGGLPGGGTTGALPGGSLGLGALTSSLTALTGGAATPGATPSFALAPTAGSSSGWGSEGVQTAGLGGLLGGFGGRSTAPAGGAGGAAPQGAGGAGGAAAAAGGSPLGGGLLGSLASGAIDQGLVGAAAGKVAEQIVRDQVNAVVQAMWSGGAAQGGDAGVGAGAVPGGR